MFSLFTASYTTLIHFGQIAHQVFRKYETYSFSGHISLLFGPPTLLALQWGLPKGTDSVVCLLLRAYVTYLSALSLSVIGYRLSPIHPLARYPGPLGAKISKFWHAFIATTGRQHHYVKRLHEQFGNLVRIGTYCTSGCCSAWLHRFSRWLRAE